jgi:hypothetical protein
MASIGPEPSDPEQLAHWKKTVAAIGMAGFLSPGESPSLNGKCSRHTGRASRPPIGCKRTTGLSQRPQCRMPPGTVTWTSTAASTMASVSESNARRFWSYAATLNRSYLVRERLVRFDSVRFDSWGLTGVLLLTLVGDLQFRWRYVADLGVQPGGVEPVDARARWLVRRLRRSTTGPRAR